LIAFAYFYVAISFNPIEVANNIKNNGGAIPGIRSGRPTVDFIKKVLGKITLLGALLVAVVACVPMIAGIILGYFPVPTEYILFAHTRFPISAMAFGGSSMMIVVGVAIETTRELEAQMSLRNYKGFLD
jgi:preprotein translocase subunit SecY